MLTQLSRLSVEADGRYATAQELQFLKDYLESFELRVSAYEKIRDAEAEIIYLVEAKKQSLNPNLFKLGSQDVTEICRRDMVNILRHAAAALLVNDLDHLRSSLLLWCRTIVHAFKYKSYTEVTYKVLQDVVEQYLTPQEAALFRPILELNRIVLTT